MNDLETQIAEWRTYVAKSPAINGHDVDELESHLREQIADLDGFDRHVLGDRLEG